MIVKGKSVVAIARKVFGLLLAVVFVAYFLGPSAHAREHKKRENFGMGFSTEVTAPESEVLEAVQSVVNDGIIQGSREYNKDKFIDKADAADSSPLFPAWGGPGKIFYKVRERVLAPINFRESNDEGTLAVRYVVQPKDETRTILQINAVFQENFRRVVHPSDGSVETAEYQDIQDRVDAIQLEKKKTQDAEKHREEELARQSLEQRQQLEDTAALAAAEGSSENLEQHVAALRHQLQRVVKTPGADLKSAPFHSATSLKSLPAGADVVILIVTPYWFGVETEDGQHGWIHRSQLDVLP
jgi:hypothetical protein